MSTRIIIPLAAAPEVIRESVRTCLAAHGLKLDEPLLIELANNAAQGLCSIDETPQCEACNDSGVSRVNGPCEFCRAGLL